MANFTFNCSSCSFPLSTDEHERGNSVTCSHCGTQVVVPEFSLEPGMQIGGYVLERILGIGGMGEVWLSHQTAMSRKVALKILSPSLTKNSEFVEQFMREVKMTGKLEHPNVITAFDAGMDNGLYYLAIAFVDGEELEIKLVRETRLPEKEALKIALSVANALNYSWKEARILHRDVKPSNIMIDKNNVVKLMDMGISKSVSEDASITQSGTIVGTPHYISPEQAQAVSDLDFRSDVYSLGATLYHMVTGTVPFDADNPMGVLTKHITEPLPDPRTRFPHVSEQCVVLINILMAKDRNARQQSWAEVVKDIKRVLKGKYPAAAVAWAKQRKRKVGRAGKSFSASRANIQVEEVSRAPMIITILFVLLVAAGGTYYLMQENSKNEELKKEQIKIINAAIREKNIAKKIEKKKLAARVKKQKAAWADMMKSIRKLRRPKDFKRAEAAIDKVVAIETSENKVKKAEKLLEMVMKRHVQCVARVMLSLKAKAVKAANAADDPSDALDEIRDIYDDYDGPFAEETEEERSTMISKFEEQLDSGDDDSDDDDYGDDDSDDDDYGDDDSDDDDYGDDDSDDDDYGDDDSDDDDYGDDDSDDDDYGDDDSE